MIRTHFGSTADLWVTNAAGWDMCLWDTTLATDPTNSRDIVVWGRGFATSLPLRDIYKPTHNISATEARYFLRKIYVKNLLILIPNWRSSFERELLGFCGEVNKLSLTFLFSNHAIGVQFLKDVGLIRSKLERNSCRQPQEKWPSLG
jgi:hypothetical protein